MSQRRSPFICCVVCLAALACKPGKTTVPSSSEVDGAAARADTCPAKVPATTVTVMDAKDGAAMYFTTLASNVVEVRRRIAALAQPTGPQAAGAPVADRRSVEIAPWEVVARSGVVRLRVTSEEIPEGARLVLIPVDPADLDAVRAYARIQGDRMRLGGCPSDFLKGRTAAASKSPDTADPSPDTQG